MISLLQYILEKKGVSNDINILVDYIYNCIKTAVYEENPENPDISWLYQQYLDYGKDTYPIEINFKDIKGFNQNKYNLLTYRDMGPDYEDYDCDMLVVVMKADAFGFMDTEEPMLIINAKYVKTKKVFDKNISNIRNTLAHELTHYVQHLSNKGTNNLKHDDGAVAKELAENTEGNTKYYICNFLLYVINPIEADARKMGFYQTMKLEIHKRLKEWKRQNKNKEFDKDDFIHYCMYHKDYHNNVLHMSYFDLFADGIKEDTWDNYKKCFDDPENKYRDDSLIYVLLNVCDARTDKPYLPLPSKKNYVMYINSEERFNNYKARLIKDYTKNIDKYKKKIRNVIELVIEEEDIK